VVKALGELAGKIGTPEEILEEMAEDASASSAMFQPKPPKGGYTEDSFSETKPGKQNMVDLYLGLALLVVSIYLRVVSRS
jgi:hypothetical protein